MFSHRFNIALAQFSPNQKYQNRCRDIDPLKRQCCVKQRDASASMEANNLTIYCSSVVKITVPVHRNCLNSKMTAPVCAWPGNFLSFCPCALDKISRNGY